MNFPLTERKITLIGLSLGLIILAGLAIYAVDRNWERTEQREMFRETRSIVEQILSFQLYMSDAESAQRGFLLTHDPQYLGPYHVAVEQLPSLLATMEQKTIQDPLQHKHMDTLRALTEKKLAELRTALEVAQNDPTAGTNFVRSNAGKFLMDDLKRDLSAMLKREYELLRWADQREKRAADEAFHTFIWGTVLALVLLGVSTYRVVRDSEAREQADRLLDQTRLLNLAPIMTRDVDGRILSWSKGYERLYGWTEGEAVGKMSHDLLQTRLTQPLNEIQATLLSNGQWTGELTHTRQDGTTVAVSANWTLLKEKSRSPTAVIEVTTDISELKSAQAALIESEARFRLLADNISQFAWIADEKGWIHWYNSRWFDYTGTTLSEMEGWGWKKILHPDHVDRVVEKISRCFETGAVWEDTFPLRGRDGQYRWFLSRAVPIRDLQGWILQWFGTNTDITDLHRTEQALQEQTAFGKAVLDSLHAHIAVVDAGGLILQVNQFWDRSAKESRGEDLPGFVGIGGNYLETVRKAATSDGQARQALEGITAVLEGSLNKFEQEFSCDAPLTRRWFQMTVSPLSAVVGRAVITYVDITSRKTAEEAQGFLAAIVTGSPDAIITKSLNGTIRTWNRGAEGLFGYAAEEIIGQSVDRLVPEERRDEEVKLRNRVLLGTSVEQFETQRCHQRGRRIDVSISMSPIRDEGGRIVAIAQTMRDITFRKLSEEALRRSEERYRALTTNIPQLIWSCRPEGACEYLSEQWLAYTGTTVEQNVGYGWLSLIHPDDAPVVDRSWKEAVASGSPYNTEYRLRAADGTYHWHLARATPQLDQQGNICGWFGTTTDISPQKESEAILARMNAQLESKSEALAAANKELEAFSYSVSHDLRAPLRTMTGFAQALIEDYGDKLEPEAARYLRTISNGASQMGRLIDDLLSFSRLSRQKLSMSSISIAKVVREIRDDLSADQAGRTIEWDVADLPTCRGDRTTVKLVLANLLGNALKYTRPRDVAKIQVGWQADDQQPTFCRIFVNDNGVGFDMRYADKLFTVFQRLHRAEEFEGTGVGLAIVQRIVHRHGGRVWAQGQPNAGATFWFTLELVT
ncbi:MAG: PAS domain S-box protein [Nitrospira sp.]|nr:PAS domain S-box protein [Nitrospira sp.]